MRFLLLLLLWFLRITRFLLMLVGLVAVFFGIYAAVLVHTFGSLGSLRGVMEGEAPAKIAPETVLRIRPVGLMADDDYGQRPELSWLGGERAQSISGRRVMTALRAAAEDDRIRGVVLDFQDLLHVPAPLASELGGAIEEVRAKGKKVVVLSPYYGQSTYLVASHADSILLDPLGTVFLPGYERRRLYYAQALANLKITPHVYAAGDYKSAPEPLLRQDMSEQDRRQSLVMLESLWDEWKARVARARGIPQESLQEYADNFLQMHIDAGLQAPSAYLAMQAGLIDGYVHTNDSGEQLYLVPPKPWGDGNGEDGGEGDEPQEEDPAMAELNGLLNPERLVDYQNYLAETGLQSPRHESSGEDRSAVGLLYASGTIVPGEDDGFGDGLLHSAQFERQLLELAERDDVSSIVIRIDSPGGSVFGAERMRRALESVQIDWGKPVVVSIGELGASGGYYFAMGADHIVADPMSITGSIGAFAAHFDVRDASLWAGVAEDGVGTTGLTGAFSPWRRPTEAEGAWVQLEIERVYDDFLHLVAGARDIPLQNLQSELAGGRVWTGAQAERFGLVDETGHLGVAVAKARQLGELPNDAPVVVPAEVGFWEELRQWLQGGAGPSLLASDPLQALRQWAETVLPLQDPRGQYMLCLRCKVR